MPATKRKYSGNSTYSKRRRGRSTRNRYRYSAKGRSTVAKICRKTIFRMAEPKDKPWDHGKFELYHNAGSPASGRIGNFIALNYTPQMPDQGTSDQMRNGDRIYGSGYSIKMMFGSKWDRPNITYRVVVFAARQQLTANMTNVFDNLTGNILLDSVNTDAVQVLYQKTYKPKHSGMMTAGTEFLVGVPPYQPDPGPDAVTREYTFVRKIWIPRKKEIKFGVSGLNNTDDKYIYLFVAAYDAYGTLVTDNIGYVQIWQKFYFRDP